MKLIIVESPTKARKLAGYLGSQFMVEASVGHVRDLPKAKLGVDLEKNFEPEYVISKDKTKVIRRLSELAQKADQIFLATDPDREGEAIAWHVKYLLENGKQKQPAEKFVRASFHEITKSAVTEALAHPESIRMDLVDAQQARRVLDRLVGYKISPVLWKKIRRGLSAGRVQSVALRLIVEREREIEAFKPEEYWQVWVGLSVSKDDAGKLTNRIFKEGKALDSLPESVFIAEVIEVTAGKSAKAFQPKSEADVTDVVAALPQADYQVASLEKKERQRRAYPPFSTSTLQQSAASVFGFTSKQTMTLAQQLYEEGFITYHRTDSFSLSSQSLDMARNFISHAYGDSYLPEKPQVYASRSKNAQEAHEAVRVTDVARREVTGGKMSANHQKLYDLIWRRFMASQMKAAIYDQTAVIVSATFSQGTLTGAKLKTTGSILKFDGWMKLFPGQGDTILPALTEKQDLTYGEQLAQQKFTQPPPRFNDASLVKELEKRGIGRPSTYASIISVIVERGYVERQDKRYFATPIGMSVNDFLMKYFPEIMDYDFTAQMEDDLDSIARGEKEWRKIVGDFYWPLEKKIDKTVDVAERMQIPVEKTGEKCPDCTEGEIVIRTGKYGKFKSCSRFPECKFTENIVEKLPGILCPLCQQGDVVVKPSRWGKSFFGCSRYPECDWASWKKPVVGEKVSAAAWKKQQAERAERKAARAAANGETTTTTKKTASTSKKTRKSAKPKTARRTSKK